MTYTPEQLSDREKIREAAMRHSYGVDRLTPDVMKSAHWPEATDDHGNLSATLMNSLTTAWKRIFDGNGQCTHL